MAGCEQGDSWIVEAHDERDNDWEVISASIGKSGSSCCSEDQSGWVVVEGQRLQQRRLTVPAARPQIDKLFHPCSLESSEPSSGFVHVPGTLATTARLHVQQHPVASRVMIWSWLILLSLGEMATTIWWLHTLGVRGVLMLLATLCLAVLVLLSALNLEQIVAIALSIVFAVAPALPAYSAMLLMVPPRSSSSTEGCWETSQWPPFMALGLLHFSGTLLPLIRAEHPKPGRFVHAATITLEKVQPIARGACIIAAWVFGATTLHVVAVRMAVWVHPSDRPTGWSPAQAQISGGRMLLLSLHALSLICAEARRYTVTALGSHLLPCLLGVKRARALTLRNLVMNHRRALLRCVSTLRSCTPPAPAIALAVGLRRFAPILPIIGLFPQLTQFDSLFFLLVLALIVSLLLLVVREWRALPRSSWRQLPLLLPSCVTPQARSLVAHVLVFAECTESVRALIANFLPFR